MSSALSQALTAGLLNSQAFLINYRPSAPCS